MARLTCKGNGSNSKLGDKEMHLLLFSLESDADGRPRESSLLLMHHLCVLSSYLFVSLLNYDSCIIISLSF